MYQISALKCAKYNSRTINEEQEKALTQSIKKFGIVDPFIVNTHPTRKNVIVGGHRRLDVAKNLGLIEVPCVEVRLTIAEEKELNIRLNKNNGTWNLKLLKDNFNIDDLLSWGFKKADLDIDVTALIDKPGKAKKEKVNIDVQFALGKLRFVLPNDVYVKWMDALVRKVGMKKEKQVDQIKKLLKLDI